MTITMERPVSEPRDNDTRRRAVVAPASPAEPLPDVQCPPFCISHETPMPGLVYHYGGEVIVRIGDGDTDTIGVSVHREDDFGVGDPHVYLFQMEPDWAHSLTAGAAHELGRALLDSAAKVAGVKRVEDLRIGDRIVIDGSTQTVVSLLISGCYCAHVDGPPCPGSVQVYTDLSEAGGSDDVAVHLPAGSTVTLAAVKR